MLAIKNGNLLMPDGKLVKGNMLIEGGVIKAVGERAVIPPKTKVIDATGRTVMPGLIDAHTHLTVYQDPALLSAAEALRRVTAINAELIGLKDTGTLAAGKRADIIIVDGNPLKDLEAMRKVSITIANGVVYDWSAVP